MNYKTVLYTLSLIVLFCSCNKRKNTLSVNASPQEFSILKTDSAVYSLKLIKDKLYSFEIIQKEIDLVVFLVNSKNEIVKEKDSPNGNNGPEQFYFYCENQGEYQLKIKPLNENTLSGKYSIAILEISTETKISLDTSEYLKDFKTFKEIFEKANSGIYRYRSKENVDSVFLANQTKINDQTTYREFYNLVWNVVDYTGSLHNNLSLPKYLQFSLNRKEILFPLPLKYIDGKLYSNSNYKTIPAGSEIIAVNGLKSSDFATSISKYLSTDGFNITEKYKFIETSMLPLYVYYAYGEKDRFAIEYKRNDQVEHVDLESVNMNTFFENYRNRHSKVYDEKIRGRGSYYYEHIDSLNVGLLSVKSFNVGEEDHDSYSVYKSFLDSVFISLKDEQNLIVDIRGNGGGSGDALMLLTTYLSNRDVKENLQAYSLFNKIPYPEYYSGSHENIEQWLLEYVNEFKNGKYYQSDKFNPTWEPNENRYRGNFILLIDPFVASAASHFAAHIKSDKKAIIIGEETGGAYHGHTGHIPVNYELPNTKLNLKFSIINLEQDVVELPDENYGNGVMPDFSVFQTYQDFLNNKDTQMNFAIDLIKN